MIKIKLDYFEVLNNWGNILKVLGRLNLVLNNFNLVVNLELNYYLVWYNWGNLFNDLK